MKSRFLIFLLVLLIPVPLLAHGDDTSFEDTIAVIFPKAKCAMEMEMAEDCSSASPHEKKLTPDQLKIAEEQSGSKIQENDNPFVYYTVVDANNQEIGTLIFVDAPGLKGGADLCIGINLDGSLANVMVMENNEDLPLNSHQFVDQLKGKTLEAPLKIGQDIKYVGNPKSGQAVLNGVRRGMYLLKAAQGK